MASSVSPSDHSTDGGTPAPAATAGESSAPSADQAKDRFREALERKRGQQHGGNGPAQNDSKVHGAHSREGGKRTFRRKSG